MGRLDSAAGGVVASLRFEGMEGRRTGCIVLVIFFFKSKQVVISVVIA